MELEQVYVHNVYNAIAHEFDKTRYSVWNFVRSFLSDKEALFGLDVGCGNGKNMVHQKMVGIDSCKKFVELSDKHVLLSDCEHLPFANNIFEYMICISVCISICMSICM